MRYRILLLLIILGGVLFYLNTHKKNAFNPSEKNVLGEEVKTKQNQETTTIEEKAKEFIQNTANTVSATTSQTASSTARFIFSNAVDTVVKQVGKLPPQDQEMIKDKLCK